MNDLTTRIAKMMDDYRVGVDGMLKEEAARAVVALVRADLARQKVKPLDLSNVLRHAFLSGVVAAREIPGHEEIDGTKLWLEYEPFQAGSYDRILSALVPAQGVE